MRKIANYKNKPLQDEQERVMIEVLELAAKSGKLGIILRAMLTKSEIAAVAQRLNIIRMLSKNFKYFEIQETLGGVSATTILKANLCLDNGGEIFRKLLGEYRYKSQFKEKEIEKEDPFDIKMPKYPGSIL